MFFPFQILTILDRPSVGYEGGEFVLTGSAPARRAAPTSSSPPGRIRDLAHPAAPEQGRQWLSPRRDARRRSDAHPLSAHRDGRHLPRRQVTATGATSHPAWPQRLQGVDVDHSAAARRGTLLGADGLLIHSQTPGRFGGHRRSRSSGRLDCPTALRAIVRSGYVRDRVFFADESSAIAAGYRPSLGASPTATRPGSPDDPPRNH